MCIGGGVPAPALCGVPVEVEIRATTAPGRNFIFTEEKDPYLITVFNVLPPVKRLLLQCKSKWLRFVYF